jgi:hypothetical protein
LVDSDGDGIPDFWELEQGLDPNDAADASADPDGDGYTNLDEFLLGQDPHVSDPPRPTITIAATDPNAAEPNNSGTITLTRTGVTTRLLTAYYTVYGSARAGTDYQALSGQAVFAIGQSNTIVTIQPVDDQSYEGAEDITLQILPSVHYLNATNALATVTIADNEVQPIRVWATPEEITEGGSSGVFAFMREGDLRFPLTVNYTLTGTATNGVTYQTLPLAITFATNEFLTNLTVVTINNTNYSGTRLALLTVLTNSAYQALTNVSSATVTIFDDEVPTVQVLADDADAREGSPVRDGRFKFLRNASVNEPLDITFAVNGTARPGYDYDALPTTITIPANTNAAYLMVHPVDDDGAEQCETVIVVLQGSQSYKIGVTNSATVLIDDNEAATYSWELAKSTATAASGNTYLSPAELVVRRTGSTLSNIKYKLQLSPPSNSFTNGMDYLWSGDVEIFTPPFGPLVAAEVRAVFDNRRSEARIKFNRNTSAFALASFPPQVYITIPTLFGNSFQTVSLYGHDRLISVYFLTNQVVEGTAATLRFTRPWLGPLAPPDPAITVPFNLGGAAHLGSDYTLGTLTNNSVTFSAGIYTVDVSLVATNDGVSEGWENVYVRLDPSNGNYSPDNRSGQNWMAAINIRDVSVTGALNPLDSDGDGRPDSYERTYGTDPFVYNDPYQDSDGDGISDLEESLTGMNPAAKDSDADGLDDYLEWTLGSNPTNAAQNTLQTASSYAAVKLVSASCYMCHQTTLNAGGYSLTSVPPVRGQYAGDTRREQIFQFLKGASYPVSISGPVTSDAVGKYTAQILVPTNGVPPEFFVDDPDEMLGVERAVSDLPGKLATLIVPKLELTWTNKADNLPLDDHPQTNAATGQLLGKRIFVGAKTPTEINPRNTVLIHIKTTPPLIGSNVWLRSFDVDDTTDDRRFDNAGIVDSNGRLGEDNFSDYLNTPKAGLFIGNDTSSFATNLNTNGEAFVEFRVGMQPGNNYRIAATVFPTTQLSGLQSGTATDGYVSAYTDRIQGGFNGALSPVLTVWRKLHLEIDSMTAPPTSGPQANFVSLRIAALKTNFPNAGQTAVYFRASGQPWPPNRYENGSVTIPGVATNQVIVGQGADYIWQWNNYLNYLIVPGNIPANANGMEAQLRDDDDQGLLAAGLPDALPKTNSIPEILGKARPLFSTAYMDLADANVAGWNTRPTLPFRLNEPALFPENSFGSSLFNNVQDISDASLFWAHLVAFGYQPKASEDQDPNSEPPLYGGTPEPFGVSSGFSVLFVESVRELWINQVSGNLRNGQFQAARDRYWELIAGDLAHEIGHSPTVQSAGDDHAEQGMMMDANITPEPFSPKTIKRFRGAQSW